MISEGRATKGSLRFTLRTVLVVTAFLAILMGWYRSVERHRAAADRLSQQWSNAKSQLMLAELRARLEVNARSTQHSHPGKFLSVAQLEGVNLRGITIQGGSRAFERAAFDNSDLTNASLGGGGASYQCASFNNAILRNARLGDGDTSFQLATFENADLSEAVLAGDLQGVSLKNANCDGAIIKGKFQSVNISAALFQNADLSGVITMYLQEAYYEEPPTYDANTKFPEGFDPVAMGWKKAPASSEPAELELPQDKSATER